MRAGTELAERARHAAAVLDRATAIVDAVHNEGPDAVRDTIARALAIPAPAGVDPVEALVTVLAASVPTDVPMNRLLGWVRPLRPVTSSGVATEVDSQFLVDVHVLVSGRAAAADMPPAVRREAVRQLAAQGYTHEEIADRLSTNLRSVERFHRQARTGLGETA